MMRLAERRYYVVSLIHNKDISENDKKRAIGEEINKSWKPDPNTLSTLLVK